MLRNTLAGIIFAGAALSTAVASGAPAVTAQTAATVRSTVFFTRDPAAISRFEENPGVTRRMVDALITAATGQKEVASAWRTLVNPADRVGIKVSCAGGRYFSSRVGVVEAIVAGLEQAGVPRGRIIVWDRDAERLQEARFTRNRGYVVTGVAPGTGYDPDAGIAAPVLGRLIWGDLLFAGRQNLHPLKTSTVTDPLSSTSHLARILSREVTRVINVPVLSDEASCGIAGALYNMTVPNLDNWRRFIQNDLAGPEALPGVYADEHIGPKVVMTIMDGLIAQYAGGPGGDPNYAFAHGTLYASKDPVALDATALRKIDQWRQLAQLPPVGRRAEWLKSAQEAGLGQFDAEKIDLREVPPAR